MSQDDPASRADSVLQAERAQRPRWRDSAGKPAPAWFRGEELDLVDATERRQLYLAASAHMKPVPWQQLVAIGAMTGVLLFRGHTTWRWWHAAAVAVWIAGAAASTLLRRRNIREHGRNALRESADWPQRLARRPA